MPIDDEDFESESIGDDRKLQLFTDRHEFTRRFAFYLNEDPPPEQILYFFGDGGNGKSLLLKHLQVNCCKRFSRQVWQQWRALPESKAAEVADFVREAKTYTPIPVLRHDFGLIPIKEDKPQDRFYGLLMLRRNLAEAAKKYNFKFPNYDFACFWYLLNKGESNATLEQLFPDDIMELLTPAIEALAGFPLVAQGVALLKWRDKLGGIERAMELIKNRLRVSDDKAEEIRRKDIDTELIDGLPKLFADDLNAAMAGKPKPERLVMLFDTHEKMWDEKRTSQGINFWYQDEWFRRLLRALDCKAGIVVAVAGRDCPVTQLRWPNASKFPIPEDYIDAQLVGHLSAADARDYLHKVEIDKADLADAVIKYASVNPDESWENLQVHPFYLGLCADVVLAERKRGIELLSSDFARIPKLENKTAELTDRLLSYVDREVRSAVHSLSACRAFDEDLYLKLGAGCHFQATIANFDILTSFSFVWKEPQRGEKWYRIHDLLRRLDADRDNQITRRAHEVLERYYRELGNVAEAIYHANRLDWERGVEEWVEVFEEALGLSRYGLCESLLAVRGELWIKNDFGLGRISQLEGYYYAELARYAEAKQEYWEAVAACDRQIILTPDSIAALKNKGNALRCLGDLQARLSEFEAAKQSYSEAIAAFNSALLIAPDSIAALTNKGSALLSLGELQAQLSEFEAAKRSYSEALAALNSALVIAPDYKYAFNTKGIALRCLGDLQAQLSEFEAAKHSYSEAIVAHNSALFIAPDDIAVLIDEGLALRSLGELQVKLSEFEAAKHSYSEAIASCNSAWQIAPYSIAALNNKGLALQSFGNLQAHISEFEAAKDSYFEAIAAYNSALQIAPDDNYAFNNKGIALRGLGELQVKLSEFEAAKHSYSEAIAAYNSALQIAPDYIYAVTNKGIALRALGDLQAQLSELEAAKISYSEAISTCNSALFIAPNDNYALNSKGKALISLGELQAGLSEFDEAKLSYSKAIASCNSALLIAPDYNYALNNKGNALRCLGDLQEGLSEFEAAKLSYSDAITACNSALLIAPDSLAALNNKGISLLRLGNLQVKLSNQQEALKNWQEALEMWNRSLAIAPNDDWVRNRRDWLQQLLNNLGDDTISS
ncbi:tetratricopeptide repeat protein [Microcoleus sp.]|uniref:tetratricopeptide repeat protein n=1 Tax=Microcoleus sp. TaxID=44472 RepID=UPI00403EB0FB